MRGKKSQPVNPPEKGSFPLDHFQECEKLAEVYRLCLSEQSNIPKKCRQQAQDYLQCRMDKGLMAKVSMDELGFVKEATWDYEKMTKEEVAKKVAELMRESRKRVWAEHRRKHDVQDQS